MCGCQKNSCSGSCQKNSCCCCGNKRTPCCSSSSCQSCQGSCQDGTCKSERHEDAESCCKEFGWKLLGVADEAWMCALKDRIKQEVERECGAQLDELAHVVASANKMRWKNKMQSKKCCSEYTASLAQIFKKDKG